MRLAELLKAPTGDIAAKPISIREAVARYEAPLMDTPPLPSPLSPSPSLPSPSPFAFAEPLPSPIHQSSIITHQSFAHLALLHKCGRKPHAEQLAILLDNFYTDGNVQHLAEASDLLDHLASL